MPIPVSETGAGADVAKGKGCGAESGSRKNRVASPLPAQAFLDIES
jgi:hypothetical protein